MGPLKKGDLAGFFQFFLLFTAIALGLALLSWL